ncbi:unnamed protein product [Paramecium pentaurelia]|uniref:Uncharacterized protein n=1 Tax=Paramecium pentaurelia TaxID=43138 RepID=A0A8S1TQX6_9CILI|nr:unnamed protein product [Paramecium pentaurelia]
MEFWVVNCFLASAAFFILFLVVDANKPYYPYAFASKKTDDGYTIDQKASATSCIVASSLYLLIAIGLLFWKMNRDQRIKESQQYPRFAAAQGYDQQQYSQRGRSIEL